MARKDSKGRNLHTGESQRKDGIYMYRYTNLKSKKRETVYAGDLIELREKERQILRDLEEDIQTNSAVKKMTLNELFDKYMQTKQIAETTYINYNHTWNNRVKDEIGRIKVVQLRPSDIKSYYVKLGKAGYKHSTIKLIHNLIYPALELAVEDDVIRKNPAKGTLKNYGVDVKEKEALTFKQQQQLMEFVRNSNVYNVYANMLTILLETALRCGELIGLTWNDVDMKNREISINHQLIYKDIGNGYQFYVTEPKTDAGVRVIPLTKTAYNAFVEQKKLNFMLGRHCMTEIDGYSNFIFLADTGNPLMPSAVNSVLYNIVNAYNRAETVKAKKEHRKAELLPKFSAHVLRHTACTNMAMQGMRIKVLQYIMGHAHSDVTLDVYSHITSLSDVRAEVEKYDKAVCN